MRGDASGRTAATRLVICHPGPGESTGWQLTNISARTSSILSGVMVRCSGES
jgi:hypothetical protein